MMLAGDHFTPHDLVQPTQTRSDGLQDGIHVVPLIVVGPGDVFAGRCRYSTYVEPNFKHISILLLALNLL